ncbi:hypothetical protein M3Y99_00209500 [Aphelenchoides fujianensis]|nr:hypothetical protein M3Y99_00209500 [Aphelenchoides fujianensis]
MEAKRADFRVYRPLSTSPEMSPNPKPPANHAHDDGFWPMLLLLALTLFTAALLIGLVTANFLLSLKEVDTRRAKEAAQREQRGNLSIIEEFYEKYADAMREKRKREETRKRYLEQKRLNSSIPLDDELPFSHEMPLPSTNKRVERTLGHVRVQFRIVWHLKAEYASCIRFSRSAALSSRESITQLNTKEMDDVWVGGTNR